MLRCSKRCLPALRPIAKVRKEVCNLRTNKTSFLPKSYATKSPSGDASTTDISSRYYPVQPYETFHDARYQVLRPLGAGRYSHVYLAKDRLRDSHVALKLLTTDAYGQGHDIFEIAILEAVTKKQKRSVRNDSHVLGLLNTLNIEGPFGEHRVIVTDVLGSNLSRQVQRFQRRRLPVRVAKRIVKQMLRGLKFLHEDVGVVHTDLQPGNICVGVGEREVEHMLSCPSLDEATPTIDETVRVTIIDLGVASWINKHLSDNIQPESLRAPEVILGAPWGPPVDIWSLGCLTIEFVKGHIAFRSEASPHGTWSSEDDHLAQMIGVLGPMPLELLRRGRKTGEFFDEKGSLLRISKPKPHPLKIRMDDEPFPFTRPADMPKEEVPVFVDFLRGALALDQERRSTAGELLRHEWLRQGD